MATSAAECGDVSMALRGRQQSTLGTSAGVLYISWPGMCKDTSVSEVFKEGHGIGSIMSFEEVDPSVPPIHHMRVSVVNFDEHLVY
mmetsp:Transcript_4865/g.7590  ORF Transcript_4865/g.7590 Transcript_4865/m.7590 type:complete len:86 (-) Transcript_4865:868-1125(-)